MSAACDGCAVAQHAVGQGGAPPGSSDPVTRLSAAPSASGIPGIARRELDQLLGPVSPEEGPIGGDGPSVVEERFARAALSTAIEPGDLEAGRLVDALGAVGLLRAIVEGTEASLVLRGLRDARPDSAELDTQTTESEVERGSSPDARAERRIAEALARWRPRLSLGESARALERGARIGAQLLTPDSRWWPEGFASLDEGPPLALWTRGDPRHLERLTRSVALVGARASTGYGEHVAMESAAGLADRGFTVVSGGAYGIDAAAHRATLASGGVTVAFLAGGADRLYPAGNSELLRRIAADGVLAAELPPGSAPTRWRFLMRNRLIAAAAGATVVVEAGHRSGSLNTAGHAAQMGRPLGAVPGSILSPASAGCHRLIREYAATCVTTAEEMAELADPLGIGSTPDPAPAAQIERGDAASGAERTIVSALARSRGASADEIAARAALPFTTVAAVLGRLDLAGHARESAGGWTLIEKKCL